MSGVEELTAESQARWVRAARRAQGIADNGMGEALKVYYTLYFPVGLVVLTVLGTVGGILAFAGTWPEWPAYLPFGVSLAAVGVLVGGLVYNAKKVRPAAELGNSSVLISLEDHEQKHVRRQILGKVPVDPAHLGVARGAAVQLRKGLATQLITAPMLLLVFAGQVLSGSSFLWWLSALLLGSQAVLIAGLAREFQQTGRFLASTAENEKQ